MNRRFLGLAASLATLALAACSSTSAAGNTTTTTTVQTPVAKTSPSAAVTPTTVDPCQLVTQSEASQLAGTTYTSSKAETTAGGEVCWYGAQTLNVFEVEVITFTSASGAQSAWDAEKSKVIAQLQEEAAAPGVTINVNVQDTSLSGADRAADGSYSGTLGGHKFAGTALYFLKGVYFVAIVDLMVDHTPPTISAIEAQGKTALGRMP